MKNVGKKGTKLLTILVVLTMIFSLFPAIGVLANTASSVKVIVYDVTPSSGNYTTNKLYEGTYNVSSGSYTTTTNNYMGLDANLTTSAASVFDAWYTAAGALGFDASHCSTNVSAGSVYVRKFDDRDSSTYGLANSGWMFMVNDKIPVDGNGFGYDAAHATLQSGDVVSIFYVTDYTKTKYMYFDATGATTSGQKISADGAANETLYLKLMDYSLNMSDKYVTPRSGASSSMSTTGASSSIAEIGSTGVYTVGVTSTAVTGVKTADGQTYSAAAQLIPAYYPIDATSTTTLSDAKTALNAVVTAYASAEAAPSSYTSASWNAFDAAYDDAVTVYNNGSATVNQVLSATNRLKRLGADLIRANDARISRIGVGTYGLELSPVFAPDTYAYTFDNGTATGEVFQLSFINPAASCSPSISGGGSAVYSSSTKQVTVSGLSATTGTYVITLAVTCGTGSQNYTITIVKDSNGSPSDVSAYLPAPGQFVTGTSWGSISTDDANSLTTLANQKLRGNPSGVGVSLGGLGGYVILHYANGIENSNRHKYGVDFIAYGNAFTGWCEPGAVMVAQDANKDGVPDEWYAIAGSEHYSATAAWPTSVLYDKAASDIGITINGGTRATWTTNMGAWPEYPAKPTGENYGNTANTSLSLSGLGSASYPSANNQVGFNNIVKLADNSAYQFGYCDVHPDGSSFGTQTNPYTAGASTAYGDGIDIDWAVNAAGEPVHLDSINFVKIYTAVSKNQPPFGEVSTEVLGTKATSLEASDVGTTDEPTFTLTINGTPYDLYDKAADPDTIHNMGTVTVSTGSSSLTLGVSSTGSTVFINNEALTSKSITDIPSGSYKLVRVIAQNGNKQPYVILLKLTQ